MNRSYKYRIYPDKIQRKALDEAFSFCRNLYNCALEERISYYKTYGKSLSYEKQAGNLKHLKKEFPECKNIYSQTFQETLKRLDVAYKRFFKLKKGFPRFKNKDRFRSICFPQANKNGGIKILENKKLKIFGIPGEVKMKPHRSFQGQLKQIRIIKQNDQYYVSLSCDNVPESALQFAGKSTAIDLGLNNFITTDQNVVVKHPKPYKTAKEKLAYKQRKFSKKQKGSNNYYRLKNEIAKTHNKIHNIREDFQHKLSKKLIEENDTIVVEKLDIKNMLERKGYEVNKQNISDASWGAFIYKLKYKAESAGRIIKEVDPRNTSKTCSSCKNIKIDLKITDREYICGVCNLKIDRDLNAAINIKWLGMSL